MRIQLCLCSTNAGIQSTCRVPCIVHKSEHALYEELNDAVLITHADGRYNIEKTNEWLERR